MKQKILFGSIFILLLLLSGIIMPILAETADSKIDPGPAPLPITRNNERIFARLTVPKTQIYLGERIPVTISLYITELNIYKVFTPTLNQPEFDFGTVSHLASTTTMMNGRQYQVIRFGTTLTPLKEGYLTLGPVSVNCKLSQNQDEDFEATPELYRLAHGTLETTAPTIKLRVKPLPTAQRPANFSGGVGHFGIYPQLVTAIPKVGDPLTVRLTVSGNGNLENIGFPVLADSTGFDVFPIRRKIQTGNKVIFEQTLVPLDHRQTRIGPYQLNFFDLKTGSYRTAMASLPVRIGIKPGSGQSTGTTEVKIAGIKPSFGDVNPGRGWLITQKWFWWLHLIPFFGLIITVSYHFHRRKRQTDITLLRRKGEKLAEERLMAAKALIGPSGTDRLLNELYSILQDYVNVKFNGSNDKTLLLEDWSAEQEDGIKREMQSFLNQYDQIRYTGTELTMDQAERLWQTVRELISRLNQLPDAIQEAGEPIYKQPMEGRPYHG